MYISKSELNIMLTFSSFLGANYDAQWIIYDKCPPDIYTLNYPFDGPPCVGILVNVLDSTGHGGPEIGALVVRMNAVCMYVCVYVCVYSSECVGLDGAWRP